ncbi:transcriptional regulator [Nocardia panacis]|uniref:Transcriptional regulator n=2 Tax=Nocardia panacis TaxID=2340916 RepID=A0A3A4K047_9NOCA|nr:transcriptional regulator [Nocardia panacis]
MYPEISGHVGGSRASTPAGDSLVVALLGEIALCRDGALAALPGTRSRLLLAALALHPGRSRSAQALIDEVWGASPPRAPMNALHTQVSRLRAALPDGALEIGPAGYRLTLSSDAVDLALAHRLSAAAAQRRAAGDAAGSLSAIEQARALWRGEPAADLPDGEVADALRFAAARLREDLDELELAARELRGDLAGALRLAKSRAAEHILDEPAHHTLMRLLTAAGRPNEALECFAAFRRRLADQLGADPGRALVDLNTAILRGEERAQAADVRENADPAAISHLLGVESGPAAAEFSSSDPPTEQTRPSIGLRAAPNALLGRENDLAELTALLDTSRVTTVLGPGGSGKTRIANELGSCAAGRFSVLLVELASVRSEGEEARLEIEAAIGAPLGLGDRALDNAALRGAPPPDFGRRLREALGVRPTLLILDNCEHLIDAVAVVVADLIGSCDRLTVLTTSRAPLMITAEAVYPLPPLAIDAAGSPATELFTARARAVRPGARLDPGEIARLCHTLDGLPLAIELAAARVRTMSVAEINTRLQDRFALLLNTDRSSPARHRTLHSVIDWSWNLLDKPQQVALRRLCRFPAGFGLDAAAAVAGGPDLDDVPAAVDGLVNQSLLTVLDDGDTLRYRMLETVREYGEEQLAAIPGEGDLVLDNLVQWACDFVVVAANHWTAAGRTTTDQVGATNAVGAELDNLLAALRRAVDTGDGNAAYSIFPVIGFLWVIRGAHEEVTAWYARILDLEPDAARPHPPTADQEIATYVLFFMHLAVIRGDIRRLTRLRTRLRRLMRGRTGILPVLHFFATVVLAPPTALAVSRTIAMGTRSEDPDTKAAALIIRANGRENLGDVLGSTIDAENAIRAMRPGDIWGHSAVLRHLASVYSQVGRYSEAVEHYRRAIGPLRALGAVNEAIENAGMMAGALVGCGAFDEAEREIRAAVGAAEFEELMGEGVARANPLMATLVAAYAELELARARIDSGLRLYRRALDVFGWPQQMLGPGPGGVMFACGALDAEALYGAPHAFDPMLDGLIAATLGPLSLISDLPQIGAAAVTIGAHLVGTARDQETGLELLTLSGRINARQDFPTMLRSRHVEAARERVGADRMRAAIERAALVRRRDAAARILELLGEIRIER